MNDIVTTLWDGIEFIYTYDLEIHLYPITQ